MITLTLPEFKRQERIRTQQCADVINFFGNHCDYLLNQVLDYSELQFMIKTGILAIDLRDEIIKRFKELSGLSLGYQWINPFKFEVKLTDSYRNKHIYIIGKTGMGKTTLINHLIREDIQSKDHRGVGIICHEYDQVIDILDSIPPARMNDLIYFNPTDKDLPISFNPLHLDPDEDLYLKIDETLTIFKRILADTSSQMDEILRHTLYALIKIPETTLLDIEKLLDRDRTVYRMKMLENLEPDERKFWVRTYPQYSKTSHIPLTHRIGTLIGLPGSPCRRMLCNKTQSLNFKRSMDEARIMLFNLSDGVLGAENAKLLGRLIMAKFQTALMSRAKDENRRPFYLYVDECHQFIEPLSLANLLSRARKYGLSLILANQQTGQLPTEVIKEIFGNVGSIISFVTSRDDANKLSKEFITRQDGELINILPEQILNLKIGQTYIKIGNHAFFMQTYPFKRCHNNNYYEFLMHTSQDNYGIKSELDLIDTEQICLNDNDIFKRLKSVNETVN